VPRWEPLHWEFATALDRLAESDVEHAEAWRLLIPVAERIARPRPTYWRVRRYLLEARRRRALRQLDREALNERVVVRLLTGRAPRL
jgi:hypothetical protein